MNVERAIFILGPTAMPLAQTIKAQGGGRIWGPSHVEGVDEFYAKATDAIGYAFLKQQPIVGICAAAILIRAVAPFLKNKFEEAAVVAVAEDGSSVVPLLGGHHGANQIARDIAGVVDGHAAITTASDVIYGMAYDEAAFGLVLGNPEHVKSATAARLRGEEVFRHNTIYDRAGDDRNIIYYPKVLTVGIGCERGTSVEEVQELVRSTFAAHKLSRKAVACFASIELKEDEAALLALPDMTYFSADELKAQSNRITSPSAYVEDTVGTPSVAEAAALAAAGDEASLLVPKTKSKRATIAIAEAAEPILTLRGKQRGVVSVVGIGPGDRTLRSPQATFALATASDWVGYDLYLDLAADIKTSQTEHRFPLGGEEARCRHAIELAKQGKHVALVCSGDAAIYAMAALVYELIDREPCRVAVEVHPGISAFQMASAKAGAMIGHDFCCISLSDLLTPWETIVQRVQAAAQGDFVVAFYNPRSLKRVDQIVKAFEILRPHRSADTPVVLASNLGRPDEHVRILTFSEFKPEDVDMLTLVMVGSSQSKAFKRGDGQTYAYTPRGYAKKMDLK
jgi:cobalt-precorrin 5A hydrolase / precorrin-3B C17-methyltransferase